MALKLSIPVNAPGECSQKQDFYQCDTVHATRQHIAPTEDTTSGTDLSIRQPQAEQLLVLLSSAAFALVCHSKAMGDPRRLLWQIRGT
ncbi:hypothetical protein GB937_006775 [Aspergillus fischeri]|nr:hypothetical protein GB937_006775 [Aspergillus fischeri]